ncbi:family 2 glycosyl transferase [Gammaproteobacteria bacterium 42_54_T18]|nr:family 2 glycosyl transferase [Gammaproteobacteria bacterium 42_54_T18]
MEFSAIILTFNSEQYIETCLRSLVSSFVEIGASYEVFVIDNGSKDRTRKLIQDVTDEMNANIQLIPFEYNTGTTFSRNQGLKRAEGKRIIILDSDAYVTSEVVKELGCYLDENNECGMVVPKLTYPDGRFQISTDHFPTLWHKVRRFFFLKKMEGGETSEGLEQSPVDYAISAFWMFTKDLLDDIGCLDERIFYSPEDVDYCIRVWLSGKEIHYLPQYSMVHDAQEISRAKGIKINKFTISHAKGLIYLFLKHRYFFGLSGLYKRIESIKAVR